MASIWDKWDGGKQGYIASQQKRYKEAKASDNTDLMNRLEADARRVGYSTVSPRDMIDNMYNKRKESRLSELRAQKQKATADINAQKKDTSQAYYGQRNQADVVNFQNQKRLREIMAASGLGNSGENVSAQVGLGAARQNALNTLNAQEQSSLDAFTRQLNDINNPLREQSIISQLEAARLGAMTSLEDRLRAERYQRERDEIGDTRYDQQFDYQKRRDSIGDKRYQTEWDYRVAQDKLDRARRSSGGGGGGYYAVPQAIPQQNLSVPDDIYKSAEALFKDWVDREQNHKGILRPFAGTPTYYNKMERLIPR